MRRATSGNIWRSGCRPPRVVEVINRTLSPCEVLEEISRGGMGIVRALDTNRAEKLEEAEAATTEMEAIAERYALRSPGERRLRPRIAPARE